jgi:hypothetical protein
MEHITPESIQIGPRVRHEIELRIRELSAGATLPRAIV